MRRFATLLVILLATLQAAPAWAGSAADVIRNLNATFIQVMQQATTLGYAGRYQTLAPALATAYDFAEMARVSTGRHWRDLTDAQRAQLIEAFTAYSTATYAARFDGYSGERFDVLGEESAPAGATRVNNQIQQSSGDPIRIDYLLKEKDGQWRIVDVYLKSSISELALRRSEFTDLLAAKGFDGLIEKLETEAKSLEAGALDAE